MSEVSGRSEDPYIAERFLMTRVNLLLFKDMNPRSTKRTGWSE